MKKYGLLGKSLKYSYSKIIHEYLIEKYKIDASYTLIEVDSVERELLEKYDGLNVTIPYKETVIPMLDENKTMLPCNTIMNNSGYLEGYNTDIEGMKLLIELLDLKEIKRVVILGGGATSKMFQYLLSDKEIIEVSFEQDNFNDETMKKLNADLLINTTPIGMNSFESPIQEELLSNYQGVIDLNYNPINSKLAIDSQKYSVKFINGLMMLIKQAICSFEIWHELKVDDSELRNIYKHIMKVINKKVALVGLSFSGKSTIAERYNGVDLDDEIVRINNKSIASMIEENTFRTQESKVLEKLVNEGHDLIACGGGTILKYENMMLLKDYLIVHLNVDLKVLLDRFDNSTRPLMKSKDDLIKIYHERKDIYKRVANIQMDATELKEFLDK